MAEQTPFHDSHELSPEEREAAIKKGINPVEKGKIKYQWTFPEFEKHDRGPLWYFIAFFGGGGLLIYTIIDGNFLFALIILLFALIIFTHHRTEPAQLTLTIYEAGIRIGDRFFLFREIESFAVIYEPPLIKQLYIKPRTGVLRNEIAIPLYDEDPVQLRRFLVDYLEENFEREEESATEAAIRFFKL
ncbi:MAG: hypothetical protein KKH94_00200 [Candidatus Omnitrophica bacterium]|nr:hypothetical protein [Patescibacteria group bacterium]MBU1862075.1 hypothetical protein [Candidatus Omnitrophota bacterium]